MNQNVQAHIMANKNRVKSILQAFDKDELCPVKGSLDYGYPTIKKIALFIEDSKSGKTFIKTFIKRIYPFANIDLISIEGHGNIKYIPDYINDFTTVTYDYIVIMYDRGRSSGQNLNTDNKKDIPRVIRRLSAYKNKLFIFSPLSFESVPLSFKYLCDTLLLKYNIPDSIYKDFHLELSNLVNSNIEDSVTYDKFCTTLGYSSVERLVEGAIENLTLGTVYEVTHNPSRISDCWTMNCCENNSYTNKCNKIHLCKLEFIAEYSALGGITYILDKIYGIRYRKYPLCITSNNTYKNKLITEVN